MKKKTLVTVLQYVIFLGLGILLIWWQYSKLTPENKQEILVSFSQVKSNLWLIFPVLIIGFLSHLFRALRWKLLLEPLNLKPTTVNITCSVLLGYLVNLLLPRMGEIARCTALAKYENEPADKIIGTIVAERSFDLVCLFVVALLTFVLQVNVVGDYAVRVVEKLLSKSITIIIVVAVLLSVLVFVVYYYRKHKRSRLGHILRNIGEGVRSILTMKKRGRFLIYTALIWGCYLALVVVGFKSMDATSSLGGLAGLSVLVFGSLGMIVTPGGLGAYPLAVQEVLHHIYGIDASPALAFGWVSWLAQTSIILVLGLLSLLVLPAYNVKPHGQNTMDSK